MNTLIRSGGKLLTYTRLQGAKSGNDPCGTWLRTRAVEAGLSDGSCGLHHRRTQGGGRRNTRPPSPPALSSPARASHWPIPNRSQWASQLPQDIDKGREEQKCMRTTSIHLLICVAGWLSIYLSLSIPSIHPSIHSTIVKPSPMLCFVTTWIFTTYNENQSLCFIIHTFMTC